MSQTPPALSQQAEDDKELRLVVLLHYVLAGITAAMFPLGVVLIVLGKPLLYPDEGSADSALSNSLEAAAFGFALIMAGALLTLLALLHGSVLWYVGRCIALRRRRRFAAMFSIFNLTYIPLGTAISIYTLVVLSRASVKFQFAQTAEKDSGAEGSKE